MHRRIILMFSKEPNSKMFFLFLFFSEKDVKGFSMNMIWEESMEWMTNMTDKIDLKYIEGSWSRFIKFDLVLWLILIAELDFTFSCTSCSFKSSQTTFFLYEHLNVACGLFVKGKHGKNWVLCLQKKQCRSTLILLPSYILHGLEVWPR